MELPVIIVNFKLFEQATLGRALELAKIHEKVAKETGASIAIAVNALDLAKVVENVSVPVFAQHIDPVCYGSYTGCILPEAVKALGAYGTLLNHAEKRIEMEYLKKSIELAKKVGLVAVACADSAEEAAAVASFGADFVAVEPPELIGGDVSVSKASPDVIKKAVSLVDGKVLVGAGIKNGEDVRIAISLGASGVLLASGVTKAVDPYAVLMDLVSGLK